MRSKKTRLTLGMALFVGLGFAQTQERVTTVQDFVPVTEEILANPADADWPSFRRTLDGWAYSPLDQINQENVGGLSLAWVAPMDAGTNESTPLVYDGVMYLVGPGDIIQALDAATGDRIWEYRRELPEGIRTGSTSRNIAIYEDKLFHGTADAMIIAVDARTGQLVWETPVADHSYSVSHSSGPIIAGGKVISPHTCGRQGNVLPGGCFITAHDVDNGEELWRTYVIAQEGEEGDETWNDIPWENRFHASAWIPGVYDAELDLIYWGTAVPAPHARVLRPDGDGDLLYTDSTLALDPETGEIVWYYQYTYNDNWDLDAVFDRFLVDTVVAPNPDEVEWINPNVTPGETRKVLTGAPNKTAMIYTLDRETGEFLWARNQTYQNIILDMDLETGRPVYNEETIHTELDQTLYICPHVAGGRNWPMGTYSPRTHAMYTPMNNTCFDGTPYADERIPGGGQYRWPAVPTPAGDELIGRTEAVSAETGETLWKTEVRPALASGLVSTGGGLVFGGDINGRFRAYSDDTGEILWETNLGTPISGYPVSYAVDGVQYIAIPVGGGTLQEGQFSGLTPEIQVTRGGNSVFVFALPTNLR